MRTLFSAADRAALARRLDALPVGATPVWGKMNCEQMLGHLYECVRMVIGELPVNAKGHTDHHLRQFRA